MKEYIGDLNDQTDFWRDLATDPPQGNHAVLLYDPKVANSPDCPAHPVVVSNPEYARKNGVKAGYTLWTPIPPYPEKIKGKYT
jgi:hypothetical protein